MTDRIITRFPPSPTGYLHIGGARTALFYWLYARPMDGRVILRIEDTDAERSTKESVDAIFTALEWLGIDWDDGPYFQSRRLDIYKAHIQRLLDSGRAYYCTCSPERLKRIREEAVARGDNPKYDGACREKHLGPTQGAVVRFKAPQTGTTVVADRIRGDIVFENSQMDDFIIARSDGTPTYNLAVVVDDITMNVNTILRGDDHISNTPKQILLYQALEAPVPAFGHLPMVLGRDKTRLSKRHGAMSVTAYREMGYHPDAVINYLVRLGWSHGDQEFFTRRELIERFDLTHVGKSAGVFNPNKLLALNAEHIRAASDADLADRLLPFLEEKGMAAQPGEYLLGVVKTLKQRSKTFVEMADGAAFYFNDKIVYDEKAAEKFLKPEIIEPMKRILEGIEKTERFDEASLEAVFGSVMEAAGLKFGAIAQPVRVALTGRTVSPGIFEMMEVLGKPQVVSRLKEAVRYITGRTAAPENLA